MKRIFSIAVAAVLLCQAVGIFAQDSGEPSLKSVLDAARKKYWARQVEPSSADAQAAPDAPESDAPESDSKPRGRDFPYTPMLISFVPGVSLPFGLHDVSIAAGVIGSITRDVRGVEGSSVFNIARKVRGVQGAGVFNLAKETRGVQGAGVFNMASGVSGIQGAGVFNMAGDITGVQGAGVFNMAGDIKGVQAAGVFNSAGKVKGLQVGLVNVARDVDGVQIGLINIAGNGIHSLSVVYEPAASFGHAYLQFGTPALYTVAGIGVPCNDWTFDYAGAVASLGLGTRSRVLGLDLDVDLSAEQAIGALPYGSFDWEGDWSAWEGWSMIKAYPSLKITAGLPIGRHVRLLAGLKADIDVDALGNRVPEALKKGGSWGGRIFDESFTVWPKWFFGLKI